MLTSPSLIIIFSLLLASILMAFSTTTWMMAWFSLEINMMMFLPIILMTQNKYSTESALKYFLTQAMASILMIFSLLTVQPVSNFCFFNLMTMALIIKLGMAPFHLWMPAITEGLSWSSNLILLTLQKMSPIMLLLMMNKQNSSSLIILFVMMSAFMGAFGGLNQSSIRKIIIFSSINTSAWLLATLLVSKTLWLIVFVFYLMILTSIILPLVIANATTLNHLLSQNTLMYFNMYSLSLLSLAGLPPFTGFIPKFLVLQELTQFNLLPLASILLITSLVSLFFYMRIFIANNLVSSSLSFLVLNKHNPNLLITLFNFLSLLMPSLAIMLI